MKESEANTVKHHYNKHTYNELLIIRNWLLFTIWLTSTEKIWLDIIAIHTLDKTVAIFIFCMFYMNFLMLCAIVPL